MINIGPFGRLDALLYRLWQTYLDECPFARDFIKLFGTVINDHIAFRTVQTRDRNWAEEGIWPIVGIFSQLGYNVADRLEFPSKHLYAVHMEYKQDPSKPKIFVSQFEVERLEVEDMIFVNQLFNPEYQMRVPNVNSVSIDTLYQFFRVNNRKLIQIHDLETLNDISQYLAWTALFGNRVNHFTAKVKNIESVVAKCIKAGIPMKKEIEGKPNSVLRQTSTQPSSVTVEVKSHDGSILGMPWPYAYYEIAERGMVEFNGFLGEQAANLFEMTKRE